MTEKKPKVGDAVSYVSVVGDAGLGEVIVVHSANLLDLRAVNVAGAPVMYQVRRDDAGGTWNSWRPLEQAGNAGDGG